MTWRIVVIENKAKLSYKNDYLIVRNENLNMIHLSEINTLLIDSTAVVITSYLISELLDRKIKIIFCNHSRNPIGEVVPYYGCHNSSKRIANQINLDSDYSKIVWTRIIKEKIMNQAILLEKLELNNHDKLYSYINELTLFDETNREGHAAKVYFDTLFGLKFSREHTDDTNAMLNYGYSILLSQFNKEIVSNGYLTQIGIKHCNEYNPYNFSSDIMEPFRPLVDRIVKENCSEIFTGATKVKLINVLNEKVFINDANQYVSNAISIYVKSVINALEKKNIKLIHFFKYEL